MTMPEGDYPLGDPAGIRDSRPAPEPLTDPDCRDGKHASCVGGPCECPCHNDVPRPGDTGDSRSDQAALSLAAGADERTGPGHFQPEDRGPAIRIHAPDKDAWLASRRTGVTASEIGVLMGFAPETWNSPHRLFLSKTGQIPDTIPETARMRYGKHNEPFIAAEFMERYPQFAVEGDGEMLFAHPVREWQMATPDRIVFDAGSQPEDEDLYPLAVLQIKTAGFAGDDWGEEGSDKIPLYIRTQVLWEMDVVGVQNGFVACWVGGTHLRVYEIVVGDLERRELALMRQAAVQFRGLVMTGEAPEVDWYPATTAGLKALHPELDDTTVDVPHRLALRWHAAVAAQKRAGQRKRLCENLLRDVMGSARRARDVRTGVVVARRDVYEVGEKIITRKAFTMDRLVVAGVAKEDADDA